MPKDGGNGRQTRRSVNAAQAAADSGDTDGDSEDDDSGANIGGDYGFSSAGVRPLVGIAWDVDDNARSLVDDSSQSDTDPGGRDSSRDEQHVHYADYTGPFIS